MAVQDIDPDSSVLTPYEASLLKVLLKKRMMYLHQGRGREAHGIYSAALIVWHYANDRSRVDIELPPTDFAELPSKPDYPRAA